MQHNICWEFCCRFCFSLSCTQQNPPHGFSYTGVFISHNGSGRQMASQLLNLAVQWFHQNSPRPQPRGPQTGPLIVQDGYHSLRHHVLIPSSPKTAQTLFSSPSNQGKPFPGALSRCPLNAIGQICIICWCLNQSLAKGMEWPVLQLIKSDSLARGYLLWAHREW